jgi:hypothetical protein
MQGYFRQGLKAIPGKVFRDDDSVRCQGKVLKKAGAGGQLDGSKVLPTLLILGKNPYGLDELSTEWALEAVYKSKEAKVLSGALIADSWTFSEAEFHANDAA